MGSSYGRGRLHLAAAMDQRPGRDAGAFVELARLAERGVLDFVTLKDVAGRAGPDASAVLARVAPETGRIGLVPAVATAYTEPSRAPDAVATLDWVSRGRAGWWTEASGPREGRPGAGARPEGSGRSDGREQTHRLAVEGVQGVEGVEGPAGLEGAAASVRWPSVGPRSPQGHPVRVVDATEGESRDIAARHADVALLRVADPARADAVRVELRDTAVRFGRDPGELRVLASLGVDLGGGEHAAEPGHGGGGPRQTADGPLYRGGPVDLAELVAAWHRAGAVDGFHLVPVEPRRDLERLVNGTVALLQHRGLFRTFYPGSTLREHLGLARPADPYGVRGRAAGGGAARATGAAKG
ncbi:LLM class flavin-dependent oxidoreductase [Streptomyces sp. LBUM 1478]|uniref:LLM class flavin-dependent oxidoreductase n=1 Tax=Streptomyces scabiei TaxID=1930 RepID=UPI0007659E17|nr:MULTISPECIES: LLM class flavin-dependent oxidoreductase [Streptomyces]MBP5864620.1 LLM class flavin-dependent oxidoreductase [Streptomyces sp. LBUM 1484]MBP5905153.1 LLM class flavin-dependent oxidoreductase [Streptomyces sp. LBUM 1478]MBP5932557.1 LLM class flavin-dependent oxidoreductase [Streptomyces sp. LBUM 1479]MBP5874722.1 LLM class flavin-dependent oxidoreductase [Streptomyces sp. LBUM 1477]MBP5882476.1 LLM class flavin-dependent oxidoreductase [Streptomyces sp. LBUM 1487]